MIICLCEGVTDRDVRDAARRGAANLDDLVQTCRAGGDCGQCRADLRRLLREQAARPRKDDR